MKISIEQYQQIVKKKPKKSKYLNCPTVYNGRKYDSKGEAMLARKFDALVADGKISSWIPQVSIPIAPNLSTRYVVDFVVFYKKYIIDNDGTAKVFLQSEWLDYKAWDKKRNQYRVTQACKIKVKSIRANYGIDIKFISDKDNPFV